MGGVLLSKSKFWVFYLRNYGTLVDPDALVVPGSSSLKALRTTQEYFGRLPGTHTHTNKISIQTSLDDSSVGSTLRVLLD